MLEILNTVCSLLKKQKVKFDTVSNELVYKLLLACLIAFSAVSQIRQFSSDQLTCKTGRESFQDVVDNLCNTLGTYTYPPLSDKNLWSANIVHQNIRNVSIPRFAEIYPGIYPYVTREPRRIYNRSPIFLPIFFIVMAVTCYIPQLWWKKNERKLMLHLVQELNQPAIDEEREEKQIESSARHFDASIKDHKRYALNYLMLHAFNICLLLVHLFLLYYVVDTEFTFYGYEAFKYLDFPPEKRPHGLARRFTLAAKCEYRHYSWTMELLIDHAICVIHLNKVYQLLLGIYWWVLCLALVGTFVAVFSHVMKIIFPALRRKELQYLLHAGPDTEEGQAINKLNFGSGFVVFMMCKNIEHHTVKKIIAEFSTYQESTKDD